MTNETAVASEPTPAGGQVADAGAQESQGQAVSPTPPTPADLAWVAAITVAKAAVIALAVDAFLNSSKPRYSGKAMRVRAIGYAGACTGCGRRR